MDLRQKFREWLGLHDILGRQLYTEIALTNLREDTTKLHADVRASLEASAKILQLLRVLYGQSLLGLSELDPERQRASNELGEKIIARLLADDKARRHTEGKL